VKALYDYEAAAPGELSVHEDDVLMLFDTEDDWILVQNSKAEGGAGYVPGNYVEVMSDVPTPAPAQSRIIVPDSVSMTLFCSVLLLNISSRLPLSALTLILPTELRLPKLSWKMKFKLGRFLRSIRKERRKRKIGYWQWYCILR
jgi:hypothetical protein